MANCVQSKGCNLYEPVRKSYLIGDGNIGYILLAEFDDTEKAILNEIMAVLKRYSAKDKCEEEDIRKIVFRGLVIYPDQRRILAAENEVFLSHYEFDILLLLVNHPGWVFTKEQIYEAV